ncbi:hypothetical protein HOK021_02620 [Streptomyces hygroscopicus]|nr:hypothetical protein HOK021_02620 [Streptomyces hygroscopicus]
MAMVPSLPGPRGGVGSGRDHPPPGGYGGWMTDDEYGPVAGGHDVFYGPSAGRTA